MPDILRLTFDFPLPASDLFERSRLITSIATPVAEFSASMQEHGLKFDLTHEIIAEHPPVAAPKKRGRKPRVVAVVGEKAA